jgi:hypothetical protein
VFNGCSESDAPPSNSTATPAAAAPTVPASTQPPTTTSAGLPATSIATAPAPTATTVDPVDDTSNDPSRFAVNIKIDTTVQQPISPWIYGLADSTSGHEDQLAWMGATLIRWGGNARTRHNWEINASNAGSDWGFRNIGQGDNVPGSASLLFMQRNERLNALSLLTIPTIGWVAKDGDNDSESIGVPEHGGPPIAPGSDTAFTLFTGGKWTQPYDPTDNRNRTSVESLPSKGAPYSYPPDLTDGKVYQDEWVAYLRSQRPAGALPPIYAMDNEPDLWADDTHVDVHPVRLGYDTELTNFLTYARAVKHADPEGLVAGPESWGVTAYLDSPLDEGGDGYKTAADKAAHGGVPWLEWFLKAVSDDDKAQGSRSLDILDVHYYPQTGVYYSDNSPDNQEKRVQAPRSLWDVTYTEPSWVARTEWPNLALIRRLQRLVEQYYPGTKVGISEWNFGGEDDISGAIAIADSLGIFGRENVYFASCWCLPAQGSPAGWAFRLYRNYDGNGGTFGTESLAVDSNNTSEFSTYAAANEDGKQVTVLLINKSLTRNAGVKIAIPGFTPGANSMIYSYDQSNLNDIVGKPLEANNTDGVDLVVPPLSIRLLVLNK